MDFSSHAIELVKKAEQELKPQYERIEEIAFINQAKVLDAFRNNNIALRHFSQTTGYGYDDIGRDTLCKLFADIFHCESAIVSPLIVSGTHALTVALFGILRPNDKMLSITGEPYDTLLDVIKGKGIGSLSDFGIAYSQVDLLQNGDFDLPQIIKELQLQSVKLVFIGRSRGYSWRNAFSVQRIGEVIKEIRKVNNSCVIMVDNCYGEFMDTIEPTDVGADLIVGSLIKNPGGGLAPTGGYIAGKSEYVEQVGYRLTSPSIGMEVGSYNSGYREYYQGVFLAPHVSMNALKGSLLFGKVFDMLGYETLPAPDADCNDIIRSIKFNTKEELISFCQAIQKVSPVDSNVMPIPWDMPGYDSQVIMAAGAFVQGASIELSADSPIKEPYIAYLQGGLTYEHVKIAVLQCLSDMYN